MHDLRLSSRCRRGGPWLALGVAAALVAVPGVAEAQAPSPPAPVVAPAAVPGPAGGLVDQLTQQGSGASSTTSDSSGPAQQNAATQDTTTSSSAPAPPSLPPQLQQLIDQLQPNSQCSKAIQADLTKLATDIPAFVQSLVTYLQNQLTSGSPPDPQQLLDQLKGLLGQLQGQQSSAAAGSTSPSPDPTVILTDLQQLVTDLTTTCAPSPPSQPASPPSLPSSPGNPPPAQGAGQPQTAQPVSYPGYAATGSIATVSPAGDRRPADPVPLAVLGAVLLLSTATAVGVRARVGRGGR